MLTLSSIGDICVANVGARGSDHILAHLHLLLSSADQLPGVLVKMYILLIWSGTGPEICISNQVLPDATVAGPKTII